MGKHIRKHYAIDKLSPEIKEIVDEMIKSNSTYQEIVDYIKSTGNNISKSAVQRYASNLIESLHTLRMIQENFSAIMEETEKYKNIDFTEPLTRLLCNRLLEQINSLSDEQIQAIDTETLIKNTIALTRAVAYKRNVDAKTNTAIENGTEQFNEIFFQALADDKPRLYKELKKFLNDNFRSI